MVARRCLPYSSLWPGLARGKSAVMFLWPGLARGSAFVKFQWPGLAHGSACMPSVSLSPCPAVVIHFLLHRVP